MIKWQLLVDSNGLWPKPKLTILVSMGSSVSDIITGLAHLQNIHKPLKMPIIKLNAW